MANTEPKHYTRSTTHPREAELQESDGVTPESEHTNPSNVDGASIGDVSGDEPVSPSGNMVIGQNSQSQSVLTRKLPVGDELLPQFGRTDLATRNLADCDQVGDAITSGYTSPRMNSVRHTSKGGDRISAQAATTRNTHQYDTTAHHPNDIQYIQKLEQKIAAYEIAKYMGDINTGPGVRPKQLSSPPPVSRQARTVQPRAVTPSNQGSQAKPKGDDHSGYWHHSAGPDKKGGVHAGTTRSTTLPRNQQEARYTPGAQQIMKNNSDLYTSEQNAEYRDRYGQNNGARYAKQRAPPRHYQSWELPRGENGRGPQYGNNYVRSQPSPRYSSTPSDNERGDHDSGHHDNNRPHQYDSQSPAPPMGPCYQKYEEGNYRSGDSGGQTPVAPPGPFDHQRSPEAYESSVIQHENRPTYHVSTGGSSGPSYSRSVGSNFRPATHEPKHRMPEYNGKTDWKSFWLQFQTIAKYYEWDEENQLRKLTFSLQGPALDYLAQLSEAVQSHLPLLVSSLDKRFADHVLPETYRASLYNLKKQYKESNREYEARVRKLVAKAYPGLNGSEMYNSLTVEHLVMGLPDSNMSFDILARKPKTVEEALNAIEWYECCKTAQKRRTQIRNVTTREERDSDAEENTADIRRFGGKHFVTEERLYQFGNELQSKLVSAMTEVVGKEKAGDTSQDAVSKHRALPGPSGTFNRRMGETGTRYKSGSTSCYRCGEVGHFARECSNKPANVREILEDGVEWVDYSEEEYESEN